MLVLWLTLSGCATPVEWRGLIKLGLVAPFSGYDGVTAPQLLQAARATIQEWNNSGGVHGYRVELVALDDGYDGQVAAARAKEFGVDPAVVAVIGRLSGDGEQSLTEYGRQGIPLVAFGGPPRASSQPGVWLMCLDAPREGALAARFAIDEQKAQHPVVVVGDGTGNAAAGEAFARAWSERGGSSVPAPHVVPVVGRWGVEAGVTAAMGSDFVYFVGRYHVGASLVNSLSTAPTTAVLLGGDSNTPALARLLRPGRPRIAVIDSCATPGSAEHEATAGVRTKDGVAVDLAGLSRAASGFVLSAARDAARSGLPTRSTVREAMGRRGGDSAGDSLQFLDDGLRAGAGAIVRFVR